LIFIFDDDVYQKIVACRQEGREASIKTLEDMGSHLLPCDSKFRDVSLLGKNISIEHDEV